MTNKLLLICFLAAAAPALPLQAEPLRLAGGDTYAVPFEVLRDGTRTLSFAAVRESRAFVKTTRTNYGFITDVLWIRFTVAVPAGNRSEWYLEIGYPLLNFIDVYSPDGRGGYTARRYGDKVPFSQRDIAYHNVLVRLNNDPGTYTYFLRIDTESSMSIPLRILSTSRVISEINNQKTIFGIFYGALLIILIYNLLLALHMRESTYFWYGIFIFCLTMVSLSLNGYGFQYLWPSLLWVNNLVPFLLFLTQVTLGIFTMQYVKYRNLNKNLARGIFIYLGIVSLIGIASLLLPYHLMIIVGAGSYIPGISIVFLASIDLLMRKKREAFFYMVAFSFLLAGVAVTVFNRFGILPDTFIFVWGFQIGTIFSIALFSLGLSDQVNTLKNNLRDMNVNLEEKVEQRTVELTAANEEIEAAMEELEAMNDQLLMNNRELEDAENIHRKDMFMASRLQTSLLHKQPPYSDRYDIAFAYTPKSGVSGDIYDFYLEGGNLTGAGLFDVSGHGISASLLTLLAKSIIADNFNANRDLNLGSVVEIINTKLISEIKNIDNFLTGILLRFKDDAIEYVNCAHPDMLLKKADTGSVNKLLDSTGRRVSGPLLGIEHDRLKQENSCAEIEFKVAKGDSLLLFTDSLSESSRPDGEDFGELRIIKSFQSAHDGTSQIMLNNILSDFYSFLGTTEPHDDLTAILITKK